MVIDSQYCFFAPITHVHTVYIIHVLLTRRPAISGQLPASIVNGGGDNGRISNFQGLMTMTLTLDWVILHTVVHHSSTSTYILKKLVDGWTDGHLRPTLLGRLTRVDQKMGYVTEIMPLKGWFVIHRLGLTTSIYLPNLKSLSPPVIHEDMKDDAKFKHEVVWVS